LYCTKNIWKRLFAEATAAASMASFKKAPAAKAVAEAAEANAMAVVAE
jgi:hypothetical protein